LVISNQSIRSPDIVEVQDVKIFTSSAHPSLQVSVTENYNSVLTKIESLTPNADEKLALDNTLSAPSASNPVVLKDDLTTYVPQADLGEVKDSVQNFSNLPLVGNTLGDLRPVVADNIIYRWNGSAWTVFIHSGTFDHTQLLNLNADPAYQHVTLANIVTLLTQTHFHSNEAVLDAITDVGSGQIITTSERSRIPSQDEFNALAGTSGIPSNSNRYVTNQDARLNTTRNPYVTVGPPGSLATFTGVDAVPLENALVAIDTGSATAVKAIEMLPGVFNLGGSILTWLNPAPLLIEAFVPGTVTLQVYVAGVKALGAGGPLTVRGVTFELNDYNTFACLSERPNTLYEDCTFISLPLINTQVGALANAANTVFRRCTFVGPLLEGIQINAADCRIEECVFTLSNIHNPAVHTKLGGDNALIDHNIFNSGQLQLEANFAQVSNNYFNYQPLNCSVPAASPATISLAVNPFVNGDIVTFTGAVPQGMLVGRRYYVRNATSTSFNISRTPVSSLIIALTAGVSVQVYSPTYISSVGYSSRIIDNMPEEYNQPYIGVTKTVGPEGSYADYRGNDESGFLAALDDLTITTLEVLPGTYTFSSTIVINTGCKIKGTSSSIITSSVLCFHLNSNSSLEGLSFTGGASVSIGNLGAAVKNCIFNYTGASYPLLTVGTDYVVSGCTFNGLRGLEITGSLRGKVLNNYFNCSVNNFLLNSGTYDQIRDNFFISSPAPVFGTIAFGTNALIIEGNHFLGVLPSKLNTTNSVWQANYPAPQANNLDGIDNIEIDLQGYLQPLSGPVVIGSIASAGSVAFSDAVNSSAITQTIQIGTGLGGEVAVTEPFTVEIYWTSVATTGTVKWQVTAAFRDAFTGILGAPITVQHISPRTGVSPTQEDVVSISFTSYMLPNPTHVSFTVTRLGGDPLDTLTDIAHVLDAKVLIPRT